MAANYRAGDLSQAGAMTDVQHAFNPPPGVRSMLSQEAAGAAKHPHKNTGAKLPTPSTKGPPICLAPSPGEQVQHHFDLYGNEEHGPPVEPPPPPPPGSVPT
jgi:hypothetical protein